jgi:NAD+ synthase (glutamine-hydrolysing)
MSWHGMVRVAAAAPKVRVGNCKQNADHLRQLLSRAVEEDVAVLVFPELSLTGYTCGDLFHQQSLLEDARRALVELVNQSSDPYRGVFVVGVPLALEGLVFNCAVVIQGGRILGVVPKSYLPNYKEFYEARWFASSFKARSTEIKIGTQVVPFGRDLLFEATNVNGLTLGVEICEDLWVPAPPSSYQALAGATLLLNLSASDEVIGKAVYRRQLVANQSGRCLAGYVYAAAGLTESTTDLVYGGHCLIAEKGTLLAESRRFEAGDVFVASEIDLDQVQADRMRQGTFSDQRLELAAQHPFRHVRFELPRSMGPGRLLRKIEGHPFVPGGQDQLRERCEEIFLTQVSGLAQRLEHLNRPGVVIGVSGGLDSTLALLVACKTFDRLGVNRTGIQGFTLPGFGTSSRTRGNARALMKDLAVTAREVDIRHLCLEEIKAIGHRPFGLDPSALNLEQVGRLLRELPPERRQDLVFENIQARMRTNILMNAGFVIGTGDLSELALGWCTYNADQMNMYNPNVGIPKTLVKFLVRWAAENEFDGETRKTLLDVVATEISPELLPPGRDASVTHATERLIGPYELHDFFLYYFLRFGSTPAKILYLATQAEFSRTHDVTEITGWLVVFLKRFFASQFKRSCMPDGPKVGSVSLSPRGDWRMPSDACVEEWLRNLESTQSPVQPTPTHG